MVPDINRVGRAGKRASIGLISPRTVVVTLNGPAEEGIAKESPALLRGAQP